MSLVHESGKISLGIKDNTPPFYGALDYFQIHFIVIGVVNNPSDLVAKCRATTKGHFSKRRIVRIEWEGGKIADIVREDRELHGLLRRVLLKEGEIYIDPLEDHVRIYGKWKHEQNLALEDDLIQAMDRISYHIRAYLTKNEHPPNSVTDDLPL